MFSFFKKRKKIKEEFKAYKLKREALNNKIEKRKKINVDHIENKSIDSNQKDIDALLKSLKGDR